MHEATQVVRIVLLGRNAAAPMAAFASVTNVSVSIWRLDDKMTYHFLEGPLLGAEVAEADDVAAADDTGAANDVGAADDEEAAASEEVKADDDGGGGTTAFWLIFAGTKMDHS
jgi:hypothetical protein